VPAAEYLEPFEGLHQTGRQTEHQEWHTSEHEAPGQGTDRDCQDKPGTPQQAEEEQRHVSREEQLAGDREILHKSARGKTHG
jgi:hypothetical protein